MDEINMDCLLASVTTAQNALLHAVSGHAAGPPPGWYMSRADSFLYRMMHYGN